MPAVLAVALAGGCRFGAYAGSLRGRGTSSTTDVTGAPAERSTSVDLGSYDLTSDVVKHKIVVLSSVGAGGLRMRSRVGAMGTLTEEEALLDFHLGFGLGYELVRSGALRVTAYGMGTFGLFKLDDETAVTGRYTAGVQLDLVTPSDRVGVSTRIGYTTADGVLGSSPNETPIHAILFQVGGFVFVELDKL